MRRLAALTRFVLRRDNGGRPRRVLRATLALPALALALAAAALLAACAPLPYRPSAGPITDIPWDIPPPSASALSSVYASERARRDAAERVWTVVAERFHDPRFNGVDWTEVRARRVPQVLAARSDAEVYRALKAMVSELREPHTEVLSPREAVDRRRHVAPRNGASLGIVDGQLAIVEVEPESPAAAAGLRAGDVVTAINGVPVSPAFLREAAADPATRRAEPLAGDGPEALPLDARDAERVRMLRAVRRVLKGTLTSGDDGAVAAPVPASVRLEVLRDRGGSALPLSAELIAVSRVRPPKLEFRWLDGDVALLRFNRFDPALREDIERALQTSAAARAVIVDLRGNGGGLLEVYRWFVGRFVGDARVPMRMAIRDRDHPSARSVTDLELTPHRAPLLQPLAVLIDSRTASAAELAAISLAEQRGALLVGEASCGCAVGVRVEYVLPDGGGLRIAETAFVSARGTSMHEAPIAPTLRVLPTLGDLRAGRDAVLDEARRRLLQPAVATAGTATTASAPTPLAVRTR